MGPADATASSKASTSKYFCGGDRGQGFGVGDDLLQRRLVETVAKDFDRALHRSAALTLPGGEINRCGFGLARGGGLVAGEAQEAASRNADAYRRFRDRRIAEYFLGESLRFVPGHDCLPVLSTLTCRKRLGEQP